tara:strand:- start:214 stop:867 length:654 start_codon:yes stop_codon:yes gene_type:complete
MGTFGGPDIVTDGLVLGLDAGSTRSYPGTGTTWYDLSETGANWTLPAASVFNSGTMNYTSNASSLAPPTAWQSATDLTIEIWYKPITVGTGCCETVFGRYDFRFFQIGGSIYTMISFTDGGGNRYYQHPAYSVSYSEWHHVVGMRRNNRFIIWIDGVEKHNTNFGTGLPLYDVGGTWSMSSGGHSNIDITSNRIYNRGLSDSEIIQNFNAQKNRFGL